MTLFKFGRANPSSGFDAQFYSCLRFRDGLCLCSFGAAGWAAVAGPLSSPAILLQVSELDTNATLGESIHVHCSSVSRDACEADGKL